MWSAWWGKTLRDCGVGDFGKTVPVFGFERLGVYGRADMNFDGDTATYAHTAFDKDAETSSDTDGNDGDTCFYGKEKRAAFKGLEVACPGARPFREYEDRKTGMDFLCGAFQAAYRFSRMRPVDVDIAGQTHDPSENGDAKKRFFGDYAKLKRERSEQHRDVRSACMVGYQYTQSVRREVFDAVQGDGNPSETEKGTAPTLRKPVGKTPGRIQGSRQKGRDTKRKRRRGHSGDDQQGLYHR